jgi:hypothetical protein
MSPGNLWFFRLLGSHFAHTGWRVSGASRALTDDRLGSVQRGADGEALERLLVPSDRPPNQKPRRGSGRGFLNALAPVFLGMEGPGAIG